MFEEVLSEKLKKIFSMKKASYNQPGDSHEQGVLFIDVVNARTHIKDALQVARVNGKIRIYAQHEKMPFGFFTKAIAQAEGDQIADLFFYDLEENDSRYQNIVERSASFVFFFSSQYDPDVGTLTSLNLQEGDE